MNDRTAVEKRSRREQMIEEFGREFLAGENQDLYQDMMVTLCRLARDGAGRGDGFHHAGHDAGQIPDRLSDHQRNV